MEFLHPMFYIMSYMHTCTYMCMYMHVKCSLFCNQYSSWLHVANHAYNLALCTYTLSYIIQHYVLTLLHQLMMLNCKSPDWMWWCCEWHHWPLLDDNLLMIMLLVKIHLMISIYHSKWSLQRKQLVFTLSS